MCYPGYDDPDRGCNCKHPDYHKGNRCGRPRLNGRGKCAACRNKHQGFVPEHIPAQPAEGQDDSVGPQGVPLKAPNVGQLGF